SRIERRRIVSRGVIDFAAAIGADLGREWILLRLRLEAILSGAQPADAKLAAIVRRGAAFSLATRDDGDRNSLDGHAIGIVHVPDDRAGGGQLQLEVLSLVAGLELQFVR